MNGELTRIVVEVIVFRFGGSVWFDGSNQTECSFGLINKSNAQACSCRLARESLRVLAPVHLCLIRERIDDKEEGGSRRGMMHSGG